MGIIRLKRESTFVEIQEGQQLYYGGDQEWFGFTVGMFGGCATVAAANLVAYMSGNMMSKIAFVMLMNEMYRYVRPYKIPFLSKEIRPWKGFGWTLGVWPSARLVFGLQRYAKAYGMELRPVGIGCKKPREQLIMYIQNGLAKDCPIAMLIGRNHCLDNAQVTRLDGSGWVQTNMANHWVTITQMNLEADGKVMLKAATWGGWSYLDLDQWLTKAKWPQAMVYFEGNHERTDG